MIDLPPLSYDFIMADPPWRFKTWSKAGETKKGANGQYLCMTADDIFQLPIRQLARQDCVLFLWATWPLIGQALKAIDAWGFSYASGGVWHKKTRNGLTAFGTGYRLRSASEPWLLGTIGKPKNSRAHRNVIEGLVREHSRKPDEAYAWAESYMPGARRADLFARQSRPGWDAWGNEATKFDTEAA